MTIVELKKRFVTQGLLWSALALLPLQGCTTNATVEREAEPVAQKQDVQQGYDRLLPLEGGSNFRDLGGYKTADGKTVRKGLLFRSGAMANLSETDQAYLDRIGFETIVDLRSAEERDLLPNQWAKNSNVTYLYHDYRIANLIPSDPDEQQAYQPDQMYRSMPLRIRPQLQIYFDNLVGGEAPIVVNCHAGQDRTGLASALLLSALGVPRDLIIEDYLLSTGYRRPMTELGDVDLETAAKTNAFAKMMLRYKDHIEKGPRPLMMEDGTPYLVFAFEQIEKDYGSVEHFLKQEIGVDEQDIAQLRKQYLE